MSFLRKLFGRGEDADTDLPVTIHVEPRQTQLVRLEKALDNLAAEMRADQSMDNPGWRARVNEYSRLAGEAMQLRQGTLTREAILDLVFEIRPVFSGAIPEGMDRIGPLQAELLSAAEDLRDVLPGERG